VRASPDSIVVQSWSKERKRGRVEAIAAPKKSEFSSLLRYGWMDR